VKDVNFRKPLKRYSKLQVEEMGWKYYNTEIHEASFAMPQFALKVSYVTAVLTATTHVFAIIELCEIIQHQYVNVMLHAVLGSCRL